MDNDILNSLLREYDQKRIRAEIDLEKRKESLYKLIPELQKIETELNSYSINMAKNILNNINIGYNYHVMLFMLLSFVIPAIVMVFLNIINKLKNKLKLQ